MLRIVICEDEEITRRRIQASLEEISIKNDIDLEVCLSTGDPFLVYNYAHESRVDILLLDIDLKNENMDGLELGNRLRKIDKNVIIVFVSSRMERILQVFSCNPFDFIPKPSINPHLEEVIIRIIENKMYTPHGHFVKIKNIVVNLDEIMYIEKQLTKAIFHTTNSDFDIYISFLRLFDCLTDNFIQISKSFIVNKEFVVNAYEKNKIIILKNNEELYYSKKYIHEIDKAFVTIN